MTSHEFWLSVVFMGGVVQPAIKSIIKWLWSVFVHRSQETIDIWWSRKRKHAEHTLEEAARQIGGSAP